jgi:antitoxin component YwqK of YwqJK toxin-antitoxin module
LKRMQEHWKDGTKDGQYFQWFGNGKEKIVGNYKDGKEAGKWFEYNKEGEIERIANYDE